MFGQNKVVNPHAFDDQPADTLNVVSIFYTLQGEGIFAGQAAIFVRLAHCNLACSFCDTYFDAGEALSFERISDLAWKAYIRFFEDRNLPIPANSERLMVITGGEPLLQANLLLFITYARRWYNIQIESNGLIPRQLPPYATLVISPKVNEYTRQYIVPSTEMLYEANALKIVVSPDVPGYEDVPDFVHAWHRRYPYRPVYLTPMNQYAERPEIPKEGATLEERTSREAISFWTPGLLNMEANKRAHIHAALLAMRYGFTLSIQMHLLAALP